MAASSLLLLIDDIATLLDDIALMTKVAAKQGVLAADDVASITQVAVKKTAGVLGDDLALNAQQVSGVHANRELAVVWAVAKGSFINKSILVPAALITSIIAPWAISPMLMLGGLFLCFEGFEKLVHGFSARNEDAEAARAARVEALINEEKDLVALESHKIKGAIRTDFILSAEIIVITLGTVATASIGLRIAVLIGISLLITVFVYGLVAAIVRLDDLGLYLNRQAESWKRTVGGWILIAAPKLMKTLSVVGTAAMFLVGGGILMHGVSALGHSVEVFAAGFGWLAPLINAAAGAVTGVAAGALVVLAVTLLKSARGVS